VTCATVAADDDPDGAGSVVVCDALEPVHAAAKSTSSAPPDDQLRCLVIVDATSWHRCRAPDGTDAVLGRIR
jgi:hypothetical protein